MKTRDNYEPSGKMHKVGGVETGRHVNFGGHDFK